MILKDKFNRTHDYLRISLTEKCNFNCLYCNPVGNKIQCKENDLDALTLNELNRIFKIFLEMGFKKFRFTGGEPFVRKDIEEILDSLHSFKQDYKFELVVTTNGSLLNGNLSEFKKIGLDRINFSLDSLNCETYKTITGRDQLNKVLYAIDESRKAGFENIKINTVIMKGINDNEILDFCEFAIEKKVNVRFIEYMPFSSNGWSEEHFMSIESMQEIVSNEYYLSSEDIDGPMNLSSPARDYFIDNGKGKISFIGSMSKHFCSDCNRLRITSGGKLKLCLFSAENEVIDLKKMLSDENILDDEIKRQISINILNKEYAHKSLEELIKLKNNNMLKIGG